MKSYAVIVHHEPEGGFWAEVPALPGCYSQGETEEELLENIREAISGVIEVRREQGRAVGSIQGLASGSPRRAGDLSVSSAPVHHATTLSA